MTNLFSRRSLFRGLGAIAALFTAPSIAAIAAPSVISVPLLVDDDWRKWAEEATKLVASWNDAGSAPDYVPPFEVAPGGFLLAQRR